MCMDNYKVFTWNPERFPEPKKMIDELKSKGFHLAVIIDPGLKIENGYKSYEDALQHNYFLSYPNGQPYIGSVWPGRSSFPDFTRSEVRQWWGEQFSSLTGKGVEGFWNDMPDSVPQWFCISLSTTRGKSSVPPDYNRAFRNAKVRCRSAIPKPACRWHNVWP